MPKHLFLPKGVKMVHNCIEYWREIEANINKIVKHDAEAFLEQNHFRHIHAPFPPLIPTLLQTQ